MFLKLFRSILAVLALLSTLGCATQQSQLPSGVIFQTNPGEVYQFQGYRSDHPDGIIVSVPHFCAGKLVGLRAEFSTPQGVRGGREPYHGIHADYELKAGGRLSYPSNWEEVPSSTWRPIEKSWALPSNMQWAKIRLMLQGVAGPLQVRNVTITC